MRRGSHRHPALETAVFAAALLLAAFVARELWRRRGPAPVPAAENRPVALNPARPPIPGRGGAPLTETAVTDVPPVKLSRVERRAPKAAAVPVPKD